MSFPGRKGRITLWHAFLFLATAAFASDVIVANNETAPAATTQAVSTAQAGATVHQARTARTTTPVAATQRQQPPVVTTVLQNQSSVPTFSTTGLGLLALALVAAGFFVLRSH